jgi:nitrogen regulatory protein PII
MKRKVKFMKLIIAYIREECGEKVMRDLFRAGVSGITAFRVHGMSGETATFFHSPHPFEVDRLPESVKLEVVCADESIDKIVKLIAQAARTGDPGDGLIAVQEVEKTLRIRDIEPQS